MHIPHVLKADNIQQTSDIKLYKSSASVYHNSLKEGWYSNNGILEEGLVVNSDE